jgi:hypothetical protein
VAQGVADRQRKDGSEHVAMVHGRVDGSEAGCEDMDASDVAVGEVAREMKLDEVRPAEPMGTSSAPGPKLRFSLRT